MASLARQDYERQHAAGNSGGGVGLESAGPPSWSRQAWDTFHAQNGFWPFGMQGGGMVYPSTFAGAPQWVFDLMGLRRPPMEVSAGSDFSR